MGAVAGRAVIRLRAFALRPLEELGEVLRRHRRMHYQRKDVLGEQRDRREALQDVEIDLEEKRQRQRRVDVHGDRVAVGRGLRHRIEADGAAGAAAILDHHGLMPASLQARREEPRDQVRRGSGRLAEDDADRPARETLRAGEARKSECAGGRLQEPPAKAIGHGSVHAEG